jgi:hypothetical protein
MATNTLMTGDLPPNIRVYKNGALYDTDKGRIVGIRPELATKNTQITAQNTGDFLAKRLDKKRNTIIAAANEAVESNDLRIRYGDMAFVADISRVMHMKATTPDDPKAVDAARFLLQESGLSDKQAAQQQPPSVGDVAGLVSALASFVSAVTQGNDTYTNAIDAEITDDEE